MTDAILRIFSKNPWLGGALALLLLLLAANHAGAQAITGFKMDDFSGGLTSFSARTTAHFEWDAKRNLKNVILKDNVRVKMQKTVLQCDTLVYMTANTTTATTRLEAQGNPVRIEQEGMTAICKRFEFFPDQKKAVLSGDPEIRTMNQKEPIVSARKVITIVQAPDGSSMATTEGPTTGVFSEGFGGPGVKPEEQKKPAGKTGADSGKKDKKPASEDNKTTGTAPLDKISEKAADEKP